MHMFDQSTKRCAADVAVSGCDRLHDIPMNADSGRSELARDCVRGHADNREQARSYFPVGLLVKRRICKLQKLSILLATAFSFFWAIPGHSQQISPNNAKNIFGDATHPTSHWTGPQSGPAAHSDKTIAFIAEDLRNGGVLGVAQGVREAAKVIGWTVKVFDAGGNAAGRAKALADAAALRPDGVVLCGSDAQESKAGLAPFERRSVPVVGWHVGPEPGPISNAHIAMNVTTDPLAVARVTATAAVSQSKERAGVVIFTDSNFAIAMAKANAMADIIRACKTCALLEIRDVAISDSDKRMPTVTKELLALYGKRWTHALAINDIYFDYATPVLTGIGMRSDALSLLSAGDGSAAAFMRIRTKTFQTGTVAEPLNLHGWQIVDELNRLFAKQPVSGFVAPVHLVTPDNIGLDGGNRLLYDPDNGYRDVYRRIWKR
ncbi:MAG TPA: substrate-binding domain-containing protein [Burkholderiales bacterium]|nr:substrate-binding domain-containing protein [Burkholderiales bacterium]